MAIGPLDLNSWEKAGRSEAHARSARLEATLKALNTRLAQGRDCSAANPEANLPMVFIVGCARSGSTLLLQWLASTGLFCFPTNIISRFYTDPYVGALVHQALYDLDNKGEVFPERKQGSSFNSVLGRAKGAAEPHDFGYFWRHHFTFGRTQAELSQRPDAMGEARLVEDLRGLQAVFEKPLAMKALQLNWHLSILADAFPNAIFLRTERDLADNTMSLLGARRSFFGSEDAWYSFKPAEYPMLAPLPAFEQCVGQVHFTNKAILEQALTIGTHRFIKVAYEAFCKNPGEVYRAIGELMGPLPDYQGPSSFTYRVGATPEERERARKVRWALDPDAVD